jgi:hypothetical protein
MKHHALNALFDAFADVVVPNSCDIVVIEGELDHERLGEAIATTVARHPVLCRPLAGGEGTPPIDLRFHLLEDDEPGRVDRHLLGLIWDEPLAPTGRPVCFHITLTPTRSYLQTIHTHVYADASACYLLTMQIAESYAQPHARMAGDPAHVAPAELLASVASWRARAVHHARGLLQTVRDWLAPPGGLAVPAGAPVGQRKLTRLTLTEDQTKRFRATARARGHSMHAFFQLAFLRAAAEFNRRRGVLRPSLRIWDFFSLRPLLDRDSARYDCLALIYPVVLDARWSDDECLARCSETVKRMRAGELLTHAARFESLRRLVPRRRFMCVWPSLFKSNVFFTNPGVCPSPLPRFGELDVVDYVTFPQLFDPSDVQFVFSTFRERLRILIIHDEAAFGASFHSELLSGFLRRLGALAEVDLDPDAGREGFVARWLANAT